MAFVSLEHIRLSLAYMGQNTHSALLSLLAMLREGVPVSDQDTDAVNFGSTVETRLLSDHFRPHGGPDESPFFFPFGADRGVSHWRNNNYAGRSLQRQRKERSPNIFRQSSADNRQWTLAKDFITAIRAAPKENFGEIPVNAAYLAVWCYRKRDTASLESLVSDFRDEFRLAPVGLEGTLFSTDVPAELAAIPLAEQPVDDDVLLVLLQSLEPEKTDEGAADAAEGAALSSKLVAAAEAPGSWDIGIADLGDLCGLIGLEEPAIRALAAVAAGMHVVFTGPPGTGKTKLAECICLKAGFPSWTVPATDQWTTFETIGGYFPVPREDDAGADRLDFLPGSVVDSLERGRCLIIDEINRADIDKAFGELFTLLSGNTVTLPYRRRADDGRFRRVRLQVGSAVVADDDADIITVPGWWRLVGSMNDADKASLKRLSMAFVRRFAFIPIDLPAQDVFERIIRESAAVTAAHKAGKKEMEELVDRLISLFADPAAGLPGIGLQLGPAFPQSMLRHADTEWKVDPARPLDSVLLSALELYIVPQFQGRPELHEPAAALLGSMIGENADIFDRHLSIWTGYVSG